MSRLGACVDSTLTWIGNNKLSSFLIVCLFAFIVSTWTLAAINADLNRRLNENNHHGDETTTATTTTTTLTNTEHHEDTTLTSTTITSVTKPNTKEPESPSNNQARRRRFA